MMLRAGLWICMAILALAGCEGDRKRADLVFVNGAEPETLDPAIITGQPEGRVVNALFEGLCAYNEDGQAVPGVAERWEISPDGKTYTIAEITNASLIKKQKDGAGTACLWQGVHVLKHMRFTS